MSLRSVRYFAVAALSCMVLCCAPGRAQAPAPPAHNPQVPTPKSVLGHEPGDDFYLANYEEEMQYFQALAAHSDRVKLFDIGKSTEGRDMWIAVISSPENLAKLDQYKAIARQLATAHDLNDAEAKKLAETSKIIIHIDGGMHSDEVANAQHTMLLAYNLASAENNPEISKILNNVILLLYPTLNPDGLDKVVKWYRGNLGTRFEVSPMPWLFQDYVGHDNNRDGYMLNMKESRVVTRTELEFEPEIFYCQHQTAPFPARIWIPPFSDPISSNISPIVRSWFNVIGSDMTAYLDEHNMPGAISEKRFDNWYPGYLDYAGSFRGEISFFTETALYKYATPKFYTVDDFPKEMQDLRALTMYTIPWKGGWWHLRDAVNYMLAADMSVLDTAARYRETMLYNRYQAARNNIRRYEDGPPYAYVIPNVQADAPEAYLLARVMQEGGLNMDETQKGFTADGQKYPAGSWVIPMNQAFSALAKELFELQKYPAAVFQDSAKPADLPYDVTGWTLPLQMDVRVDAVTDPITADEKADLKTMTTLDPPPTEVEGAGGVFVLSHKPNNSFRVINAVLKQGGSVVFAQDKMKTPEGEETGAIVIRGIGRAAMGDVAKKYFVSVMATDKAPEHSIAIHKAKVGLYRPWDPSIDEGWTRWILEQYGFAPISLYNADMHAGGLRQRVDVIILPDMSKKQMMDGFGVGIVPGEYAGGLGTEGIDNLREFVREGGTLIAFNQSADTLLPLLSLPVTNAIEGAKPSKFFCSGALLRVELSSDVRPATYGLSDEPTVMFEHGPAFVTKPGFKGAVLASYPKESNPLQSGLLLHPEAIEGKAAALEIPYGTGHIFLFGFKPQWRAQSHGTYKFFFNELYNYEQPPYPKPVPQVKVVVTTAK